MTRLIHLGPVSVEIAGITDWSEKGIDGEAPKNNKNSKSKQCRENAVKQKEIKNSMNYIKCKVSLHCEGVKL